MKICLVGALVGLAISFAVPTFAQQKETTPSQSTPEVTPTPTLGEHDTQVLPDRRVTFRLLAPKASDVKVLIGVKSGIYEPQGTTTTEMTKNANGLWTVTLGPFEPNLYEYNISSTSKGLRLRTQATTCPNHSGMATRASC
jgi:1,4-alpha-glucan branching enzyme